MPRKNLVTPRGWWLQRPTARTRWDYCHQVRVTVSRDPRKYFCRAADAPKGSTRCVDFRREPGPRLADEHARRRAIGGGQGDGIEGLDGFVGVTVAATVHRIALQCGTERGVERFGEVLLSDRVAFRAYGCAPSTSSWSSSSVSGMMVMSSSRGAFRCVSRLSDNYWHSVGARHGLSFCYHSAN